MKNPEQTPVELPDGELTVWCQLAPYGNHPGQSDGKRVTQVCDVAAFHQVAAAFVPETLVDFEHRAENTDDTTAAAWIQRLEVRGDGASPEHGLWGLLRFTDLGAEAVRGRRLRFLSPVWSLDGDGRPALLKSAALTNTPNFSLRPILNKAGESGNKAGESGSTQKKEGSTMKELAALFGLPETAAEADVLAAAKAAMDKTAALEQRVAEMEKASLEREAGDVADKNPNKVQNKAEFVKAYVENKALCLRMLAAVKESAPVCNKADGKAPVFGTVQNKLSQYEAMPAGPDKARFLREHAAEINDLRNATRAAAD